MILVTGATGFVGQKILKMGKDKVACPSLRNVPEDEETAADRSVQSENREFRIVVT